MQSLKSTKKPLACSDAMEWRVCRDFPGYFVSESGDLVFGPHNRRMKGFIDYDGYPAYKLKNADGEKKQVAAHQLVANEFLGPKSCKKSQVRHLNGSRLNCHFENLKWGDAAMNRQDIRHHGTSSTRGERNPKAKLSDQDVRDIRKAHRDIKEGRSDMKVMELASLYGLHIATVCNIASRKAWGHVK